MNDHLGWNMDWSLRNAHCRALNLVARDDRKISTDNSHHVPLESSIRVCKAKPNSRHCKSLHFFRLGLILNTRQILISLLRRAIANAAQVFPIEAMEGRAAEKALPESEMQLYKIINQSETKRVTTDPGVDSGNESHAIANVDHRTVISDHKESF